MKHLTKLVSFLFVLVITNQSISQNFGECGVGSDVGTEIKTPDCSISSNTWLDKYRKPGFWTPNENTPIKTILVNYVVCRDNNGLNGWQDTQQFRDEVDLM